MNVNGDNFESLYLLINENKNCVSMSNSSDQFIAKQKRSAFDMKGESISRNFNQQNEENPLLIEQ